MQAVFVDKFSKGGGGGGKKRTRTDASAAVAEEDLLAAELGLEEMILKELERAFGTPSAS